MTIAEIIYDVLEIKNAANDDSDIDQLWLLYKINSYREAFIQESYRNSGDINPQWILRYPVFDFIKVNSSDDPNISYGSMNLGKFELPALISLPHDLGLHSVFPSSRMRPFSYCDFVTMMYRAAVGEELPRYAGYVSRLGNLIYVYPYVMQGAANIIPANPMDVPVIEDSGYRTRNENDQYPADGAMAQSIVLSILTKDLKLLEESVSDIVNDSQSQLKILQSDGATSNT